MNNEIWKEIEGFEGLYYVSNYGNIKSLYFNKELILKQVKGNHGYYAVNFYKNKKNTRHLVHRLVAKHFVDNIKNKEQINHIDGNKLNNHFSNLQWVTPKENSRHAWNTGLCETNRISLSSRTVFKGAEASRKPIYSKKLDITFESETSAAIYIKENYFNNKDIESIKGCISRLLLNKNKKSKYDYGWEFINK